MMTKEILRTFRDCHVNEGKDIRLGIYESGWSYGYAAALDYVLNHWEEIYQAQCLEHAVEDAKNHLRDYIEDEKEYEVAIHSSLPQTIAERFSG